MFLDLCKLICLWIVFFLIILEQNMNHEDQSQDFRVIPCDDFSLNVFLDNIANEITDEEVERLKFFCSGNAKIYLEPLGV